MSIGLLVNASLFPPTTINFVNLPSLLIQVIPWPILSAFYAIRGSIRLTISLVQPTPLASRAGIMCVPYLGDLLNTNPDASYDTIDIDYLTNAFVSSTGYPLTPATSTYLGHTSFTGVGLDNRSNSASITIEVPYNWITKIYPTGALLGNGPQPPSIYGENPWGWLVTYSDTPLNINIGFGDDMRLGHASRQPAVVIETAQMIIPNWT